MIWRRRSRARAPRVGVGVLICAEDARFLMGKRWGAHGAGRWTVPGGHVEFGETPEQAAHREVYEEVGVTVADVRFVALSNDVNRSEGTHYVTLWYTATHIDGTPSVREPDKLTDLRWVGWDELPSPLFLPWHNVDREMIKQAAHTQARLS